MEKLEKLVFLEITNKQFGKFPNSEYFKTFNELSQEVKDEFGLKISKEIHDIWTRINIKQREGIDKYSINSIDDYIEYISPVNEIILKVMNDYGLTLKNEITEEFKNAVKKILGEDYLRKFLDGIN